ncbi:MAG: lipopolysaccharide biosynthesis protein [Rhodocyclaceae bacterium]
MSAHRGRVARSLVWTTLESFGLCGVSLISLVVYARFLSPTELGVTAMALSIVQILNIPVEILFHDALVQRKEATRRHFDTAFCGYLVLGVVLGAVCWFGAGEMSSALGEPAMAPVLQWMGLSLPCMGVGSVLIAWQRRAMEFRPLAIRSLGGRLSGGLVGIGMALAGAGVWSIVAQQVLMVAFSSAALWVLASDRPRLRFHWTECKELLSFGVFTTTYQLIAGSIQRVFTLMLGAFLGSEVTGYFNLAFRSVNVLRDLFAGAVSQLSLPLFSRLQGDAVALRAAYASAVQFSCALMFPLFTGLAVCAPEVVTVAFGDRWLVAAPLFAAMALLTYQYFSRMFAMPLMNAAGRPSMPLIGISLQLIFVVAAMWLFGRESLWWAAVAWAGRLLVSTPVDMFILRRTTGLGLADQWRGVPRLLVCAVGMGAMVLGVQHMLAAWPATHRLPVMIAVGALAYPALLWLLDRDLMRRVARFMGEVVRRRTAAATA